MYRNEAQMNVDQMKVEAEWNANFLNRPIARSINDKTVIVRRGPTGVLLWTVAGRRVAFRNLMAAILGEQP